MDDQTVIEIAGASTLQNEMLAEFIAAQLKSPCRIRRGYSIKEVNQNGHFILMNCLPLQKMDLLKRLETEWQLPKKKGRLALFHVNASYGVEARALRFGLCGVLHKGISLNTYPKAIQAMIDGDLWYQRHVLEAHFLNVQTIPTANFNNEDSLLTMREHEIICLLAKGDSNAEIGRKLHVSPHTVKTHAYKIYKKINVNNRLYAALWTEKNLKN
jgi:LuxR family transcriptional regulator of csgAB operon